MHSADKLVFVVDDDPSMRKSLSVLLSRSGFNTALYESAEAFLSAFEPLQTQNACMVLDIHLDGMSGVDLAGRLSEAGHQLPVIFITGNDNAAARRAALQESCVALLTKPFPAAVLLDAIDQALTPR
jgi:FixJ family two-component response regulator